MPGLDFCLFVIPTWEPVHRLLLSSSSYLGVCLGAARLDYWCVCAQARVFLSLHDHSCYLLISCPKKARNDVYCLKSCCKTKL